MINNLVCLGLILVPYLTLLGFHGREDRLMFSSIIALILGISWFCNVKRGKLFFGVIGFIAYIGLATYLSPKQIVIYNGVNVRNFYVWRCLFYLVSYSMAFLALVNTKVNKKLIETVIIWTATVMAFHSLVQATGILQFVATDASNKLYGMVGFLGNRAILSCFLALCVPIAIHNKKYVQSAIIILAVIITRCQVPIFSLLIGGLVYVVILKPRLLYSIVLMLVVFATVCCVDVCVNENGRDRLLFSDSYRLMNWKATVEDSLMSINGHSYFYTGKGLGSYKLFYHIDKPKNMGNYYEVHNEYLEVLYELGLYGLLVVLGLIYLLVFNVPFTKHNAYLYATITTMVLIAWGMFIWQLGSTAFYSLIILAIHNNKYMEINNGSKSC